MNELYQAHSKFIISKRGGYSQCQFSKEKIQAFPSKNTISSWAAEFIGLPVILTSVAQEETASDDQEKPAGLEFEFSEQYHYGSHAEWANQGEPRAYLLSFPRSKHVVDRNLAGNSL